MRASLTVASSKPKARVVAWAARLRQHATTVQETGMDPNQSAIIRKRLKEEGFSAEAALDVFVQTLSARHVDCELEKLGRPLPPRGGQPRRDALVATQDALDEGYRRKNKDEPNMAEIQKMLFNLLTDCQFAAEKKAGLDEDDPPGHMRLVTD
jgi:hypothetical protein